MVLEFHLLKNMIKTIVCGDIVKVIKDEKVIFYTKIFTYIHWKEYYNINEVIEECEECHGTGICGCDLGYEHDCPHCDEKENLTEGLYITQLHEDLKTLESYVLNNLGEVK